MRLHADDIFAAIEQAIGRNTALVDVDRSPNGPGLYVHGRLNLDHVAQALSERIDDQIAGCARPLRAA